MSSMPTKPFTILNFSIQMIKKLLPIALVLSLASCDKKFNDIGAGVLPANPIQGKKGVYPVNVSHTLIDVVQTNASSLLQLGERQDNLFGTTTSAVVSQFNLSSYAPAFGDKNTALENSESFDEQETVTDVWLEIPFFTNQTDADGDGLVDSYDIDDSDPNSDSDGDGVSDIDERNAGTDPLSSDTDGDGILDGQDSESENPNAGRELYDIDSIFGSSEATFDIEITKLNYFLRQLDPNNNFEQIQPYYSNFNIESYKGPQLGKENIQLDFNEISVEGANTLTLTPRLRVPLDKDVFQQLIIDKEGTVELSTPELWQDYFRSVSIETSNFSAPLLMLLDFNRMLIRMAYSYRAVVKDSNPEEIEVKLDEFLLNVGVLKFNTFTKTGVTSPELAAIVSETNPAQIALGGGLGSVATINLFEDEQVLDQIKDQSWLLNEANLTFHVDKQAVEQYELSLPERLYLYNANTNAPIIDFSQDGTSAGTLNKLIYGGFLTEEDGNQYYKVRITDYLRNIITNDSINAPLRLALTDAFTQNGEAMAKVDGNTELNRIPAGTLLAPKSALFVGPNPDPTLSDLKLQLELFYTDIE